MKEIFYIISKYINRNDSVKISKLLLYSFLLFNILIIISYKTLSLVILFSLSFILNLKILILILFPSHYYTKIEVKEINPCNLHILDLFLEILYINTFLRIYSLLKKLKPSKKWLIFILFLLITSIPIRLYNFIYIIWKHNIYNREKLEIYYLYLMIFSKGRKIELLENEIFLNCYTSAKLVNHLKPTKTLSQKECYEFLCGLRIILFKHKLIENKELIKFEKAIIFDEEMNIIQKNHWTHYENDWYFHTTSNKNFILLPIQKSFLPINGLIKQNASDPGTIATQDKKLIYQSLGKYIYIPKNNFYGILNEDLFDIPEDIKSHIYNKDMEIKLWLYKYNIPTVKSKEITLNHASDLILTSPDDLKELSEILYTINKIEE